MLPPNSRANVYASQYPGVSFTAGGTITAPAPQTIDHWNQWMMQYAENWDPFIQKVLLKQPRHWYNAIPRGVKENFSGFVNETRIFRGGLSHYNGLSMFRQIDPVPSATNNPCSRGGYTTSPYAWEGLSWLGYRTDWGSDPICLDMWQYTPEAMTQLAWILEVTGMKGIAFQEVWNRDWLIRTATVDADRGFLMSKTFNGNPDPFRFYYDPLVDPVALNQGLTKPFVVFPAGVEIETLNFDMLGALKDDFDVSCPDAAIGTDAGQPIYGLPVNQGDFENYIKGSEYETANWREARAEKLITGVSGVKTHRNWALNWDRNQIRFKITKVVDNYDSSLYGDVGAPLDGTTVVIAEAVDPQIPGRTGENGSKVPVYNPEYGTAELAIAPLQLNRVFTNLFGTQLTSLGSQTVFGPHPGLNGRLSWLNIQDRQTNPHRTVGNFEGEFKVFPKPDPKVFYSTAVLYRRCTEAVRSRCPVDNATVNADTAVGTTSGVTSYACSAADVAANAFTVTATLAKTLPDTGVGKALTLTFGGVDPEVPVTAYAVKVSSAPVYQFRVVSDGTMDLVALADAAATKYHIGANGHLYYTPAEGAAVELTLESVSAG